MTQTPSPSTPNSPTELLQQQEQNENLNFQRVACEALLQCSAEENHQVALVILESLRDWHLNKAEEAGASPAWLVDAARLDVALKTTNLISWQ
jgi:hypothetical protein